MQKIPLGAGESIRVAFFVQRSTAWPNWRSVWRACQEHPRIVPHVVLLPTVGPTRSLVELDRVRQALMSEDVPFTTAESYDLAARRPHVAFLADPYDANRPEAFRAENLAELGIRLAYVPYALEVLGGAANLRYQYGLPLQQLAWRIFASSRRHRRMYARHCPVGNGHVVVTGHPKIDGIVALRREDHAPGLRERIGGRRTFLWAPHFTLPEPPMWSSFDRYVETILDLFGAREDLFLVVRPHPMFFPRRRGNDAFGLAWERAFRERLAAMPNVVLDELPDHHCAFALADALMTDPGSFLLEFLATGRPILYLRHPEGIGLSEEGDCIEVYDVADTGAQIVDFVDRVARGEDPRREERLARTAEFLHRVDGRNGERVCQAIVTAMETGDDGSPVRPVFEPLATRSRELRSQRRPEQINAVQQDLPTMAAVQAILEARGPFGLGLDTNANDGRFTSLLARHCHRVHASDVSSPLVQRSRDAFAASGIEHVAFEVASFEDCEPTTLVDVALCVDTFVHVLDDLALIRGIDRLVAILRPGATVVVRQATARAEAIVGSGEMGFRLVLPDALPRLFAARGVRLVEETVLFEAGERVERLYVFEKNTGAVSETIPPPESKTPEAEESAAFTRRLEVTGIRAG